MKPLIALTLLLSAAAAHAADDSAERQRIADERAAVEASFSAEQKACYRKFAVNDCLRAAQRVRNAAMADLRRQEGVLNDAERKRRAAERQKAFDERNSPEQRAADEARRKLAVQEQKEREARGAEKAQKKSEDDAKKAAHPPRAARAPSGPSGPQGTPRTEREPRSHGPTPEQAAKNRAAYEARIKAAEAHAAQLRERTAKRKKPAASDLPVPQ
jgi:colicin import membrane protein